MVDVDVLLYKSIQYGFLKIIKLYKNALARAGLVLMDHVNQRVKFLSIQF